MRERERKREREREWRNKDERGEKRFVRERGERVREREREKVFREPKYSFLSVGCNQLSVAPKVLHIQVHDFTLFCFVLIATYLHTAVDTVAFNSWYIAATDFTKYPCNRFVSETLLGSHRSIVQSIASKLVHLKSIIFVASERVIGRFKFKVFLSFLIDIWSFALSDPSVFLFLNFLVRTTQFCFR